MKIDRNQSRPLDAMAVRHPTVRVFVLARHAESFANVTGVVSTDPGRPVGLTRWGRAQARQLGAQLAHLEIDLAVCSRLLRTQQTVELALQGRPIPVVIEEDFDELRAGDLEEQPIETYWSWERQHTERAATAARGKAWTKLFSVTPRDYDGFSRGRSQRRCWLFTSSRCTTSPSAQ